MSNPDAAGPIAEKLLEEGNTACKIDPFTPLFPGPRDVGLPEITQAAKIWKAIRDAVGNELEVGIGTHGQLTTYSAIRVADFLEEYHPFWFEEPVPPENIEEMAEGCSAHVDTDRNWRASCYQMGVLEPARKNRRRRLSNSTSDSAEAYWSRKRSRRSQKRTTPSSHRTCIADLLQQRR